ncbi:MAG: hypothetical protein K1Y02_03635 [Candidatus Hydrogenedentes bacterium]|nr:hypothetical protein [Candidatus Hydrogenedentota bacterium]
MVLVALVGVLCYRVYVVVFPPAPKEETKKVAAQVKAPEFPTPPVWPPERQPAADASGLVRRNPFTIYGVQADENTSQTQEEQTIPVTLTAIKPWNDGTLRAMLSVSGKRVRPFKEGEAFEAYTLERIDADAQTVDVYSQEFDKVFTLQVQGGG